jgi:SAM-dependent methyltransferase
MNFVTKVLGSVFEKLGPRVRRRNQNLEYWEKRAKKFGVLAVLNLAHGNENIAAVTDMQESILFPLLESLLVGTEKTVLDFGCGPGRFTRKLAKLVGGRAVGVDPVQRFLDIAERDEAVEFRLIENGSLPIADCTIDVAWVCLVMGAMVKEEGFERAIAEIDRVLKPGGLLFLVENTHPNKNAHYWVYRRVEDYQHAFSKARIKLEFLCNYDDLGEQISVMAGRKPLN